MSVYIQEAINLYVSKVKEYKNIADQKGVQVGVYQGGGNVSVGGAIYPSVMAADINLRYGQILYVALTKDLSTVVILG